MSFEQKIQKLKEILTSANWHLSRIAQTKIGITDNYFILGDSKLVEICTATLELSQKIFDIKSIDSLNEYISHIFNESIKWVLWGVFFSTNATKEDIDNFNRLEPNTLPNSLSGEQIDSNLKELHTDLSDLSK